jgi:hypothetical protein
VALIRCTCIYRTATDDERAAGRSVLAVEFPDPWCPALDVHERRAVVHTSAPRSDNS